MKVLAAVVGNNPEALLSRFKVHQEGPQFRALDQAEFEKFTQPQNTPVYVSGGKILDLRDIRYNVSVTPEVIESLGPHWVTVTEQAGRVYFRLDEQVRRLLNERELSANGVEFQVTDLANAPEKPDDDLREFLAAFTLNKIAGADRVDGVYGVWEKTPIGWTAMDSEATVNGIVFPSVAPVTVAQMNFRAQHEAQKLKAMESYKGLCALALELGWPQIEKPSMARRVLGELLGDSPKESRREESAYEGQPFVKEFRRLYSTTGAYAGRHYCPVKALLEGPRTFAYMHAAYDITPDVIVDDSGWKQISKAGSSELFGKIRSAISGNLSELISQKDSCADQTQLTDYFIDNVLNKDEDRRITYYSLTTS